MPAPPVTLDTAIFNVGGPQTAYEPLKLWTWGQVRTTVFSGGSLNLQYFNFDHAYMYVPGFNFNGITAVEDGLRLFRGPSFGCQGYVAYVDYPTTEDRSFFVDTGMDYNDLETVIVGSLWSGTEAITATSDSYTEVNGQDVGTGEPFEIDSIVLPF